MLYATLSDSLANKLPFLVSPFRFLSHLLGDEAHPIPGDYDRESTEYYHAFKQAAGTRRIKETSAPFRALASGAKSIFSLYRKEDGFINREQILRDLFQPLIGILNVVRGAIGLLAGLLVGLAGLLYMIPLTLFTLYCIMGSDNEWNYSYAANAWTNPQVSPHF